MATNHPAKFNDAILTEIDRLLPVEGILVDFFAGTGRIHELGRRSVGVELEFEWASQHPQNIVGNALLTPFADKTFDMAASSPTYANRMADHHNARDSSKRMTYKHQLGRDLHPDNSGQMGWGKKYWDLHQRAYRELSRILKPNAPFVLNVKDHYRKDKLINVVGWHQETLTSIGFSEIKSVQVPVKGMKYGANSGLRVDHECVILFMKDRDDG